VQGSVADDTVAVLLPKILNFYRNGGRWQVCKVIYIPPPGGHTRRIILSFGDVVSYVALTLMRKGDRLFFILLD
jgi:hypothetical protein